MRAAVCLLVSLLSSTCAPGAQEAQEALGEAPSRPFWGRLQPGPHTVGFEVTWQLDYSRVYATNLSDGAGYGASKAPRPILVATWYPALPGDGDEGMRHGGYLRLGSDQPRLRAFSKELAAQQRRNLTSGLFGKPESELSERELAAWQRFLDTPTAAVEGAEPAPGKFPLVVYHAGAGSSYEDNSVLCEYLASHGYVVIGSAFQEGDGESLNTYGGNASVDDLAFLVSSARQMPQVDWQRVAVGGHSAGAHAVMELRARPLVAVDALFVLDTTQDYHTLSMPLWRFTRPVIDHAESFTVPLLAIAGPTAIWDLMDRLEGAERYYFTIGEVRHSEFTSQGVLNRVVTSGLAVDEADEEERLADAAMERFGAICEYILTFLDAHLKRDPAAVESLAVLYRGTELGLEPHVEHVPAGAAMPTAWAPGSANPPTPRQLRRLASEQGVEVAVEVLKRFRTERADHPIYDSTFAFAWLFDLLTRGEVEPAQALARPYEELDGGLSETFLRFCKIMSRLGFDEARSCFEGLLAIDAENAEALAGLSALGGSESGPSE